MRLHNLSTEIKEKIRGGDIKLLKGIIEEDLEQSLNELLDIPLDKVEKARGRATALRSILKVLG